MKTFNQLDISYKVLKRFRTNLGNWISVELAENLICCRFCCPNEKSSQARSLNNELFDLYKMLLFETG